MRRRIARDDRTRTSARALPASAGRATDGLMALCALGFIVLAAMLLLSARVALADPASPDPVDESAEAPALLSPDRPRNLDELLVVPRIRDDRTAAERTDASLADAVARRGGPARTNTSGFRKRNLDLFRAERPVEVGEQEMLLRLRLRAKSRETMSVELRF